MRAIAGMSAARCHRALRTDDVLACVLSKIEVRDGCVQSVASVCKAWRSAWCRRAKGSYRLVRARIGNFRYGDHISATPGGGIIVPDYNGNCLHRYSRMGGLVGSGCEGVGRTPIAMALLDDGTAWVGFSSGTIRVFDLAALDLETKAPVNQHSKCPRKLGNHGMFLLRSVSSTWGRILYTLQRFLDRGRVLALP